MGKMRLNTEQLKRLKPLSVKDVAYIAGFLDADGSIMIQAATSKGKKGYRLGVNFSNRNIDVLQWIFERCGSLGVLREQPNNLKNPRWSMAYHYTLPVLVAEWLLRQVESYLIVKRQQALLAIKFCDLKKLTRAGGTKGKRMYEMLEPEFVYIRKQVCGMNSKSVPFSASQKKSGELQGTPNSNAVGNLQPIRQNVQSK